MTLIDLANPIRFLTLTAPKLPWLAAATVILLPIGAPGAWQSQASECSA
jgi:heme exporter protein C